MVNKTDYSFILNDSKTVRKKYHFVFLITKKQFQTKNTIVGIAVETLNFFCALFTLQTTQKSTYT